VTVTRDQGDETMAGRLHSLGASRVLVRMARNGQILELKCDRRATANANTPRAGCFLTSGRTPDTHPTTNSHRTRTTTPH
jgi:hypothetical protein